MEKEQARNPDEEILVKGLSDLQPGEVKGIGARILGRLRLFEGKLVAEGLSDNLISWLGVSDMTVSGAAKILGVDKGPLKHFYDHFQIPRVSKQKATGRASSARWEDQSYRAKMSDSTSRLWEDRDHREKMSGVSKALWQDPEYRAARVETARKTWCRPEYREKMLAVSKGQWDEEARQRKSDELKELWKDPDYRARTLEVLRRPWDDPEHRSKMSQLLKARWQDPEFRQTRLEVVKNQWRDPVYRAKMIEAVRKLWENPEYRKKLISRSREARLNPDNVGKYVLPTIQGFRRDIGFFAQSAWEANFARVLMCTGRKFSTREVFELVIPEEISESYSDIFKSDITNKSIDFISINSRGDMVAYEIMAHPKEDPGGWIKLDLLAVQYPSIKVVPITERKYKKLRKRLEQQINSDPHLCGWETYKDNVITNPEKYS